MHALVEDAAESLVTTYVKAGDPLRVIIGSGSGHSGAAFAMPWCGRCPL